MSLKRLNFFNRLIHITSDDSDESRRRQLLNIILLGVIVLTIILMAILIIYLLANRQQTASNDIKLIFIVAGGLLLGTAGIYFLNRYVRRGIASIVFLVFFVIIFNFADSPDQLANGRSIILFSIPIVMASILLKPYLSFIFAAIVSLDIILLALWIDSPPNFPAITVFFLLALLSWLAARSLDQALHELRRTNATLDQLVQERTRQLEKSLSRERIEAGRNQAILESIADGVIVFDVTGTVINANPALLQLLEREPQEVKGMNVNDLTRSRSMDARNRGILAGLLTNPGQQGTSYRISWKKKTLSVTSSQVFSTEGVHIGTVAVFRDFTREAEIERMKNTFLAVVSHELRTPLNSVLGYAEMLKEAIYGPINEKQIHAADRIISNSSRLLSIINDLLDQAQIEAGRLIIHPSPFKLAELIKNVHEVLDKLSQDKGLVLTSGCDPRLPDTIVGDQVRLQQILINLINNSIKFTRQGSIHFRAVWHDRKHWRLEVQDSGIGIPQEELSRIFDSFHQVNGTASRESGGFGLGLSIVKQLAGLMGGSVTAVSKVGEGSLFTVLLPLDTQKAGK